MSWPGEHTATTFRLAFFATSRPSELFPVARFVEREVCAYLECGVLAHGFLRAHCDACGRDRLVAFSRKVRGFCPSCGGQRMADTAAHLVDRVLPAVPMRQWVDGPLSYRLKSPRRDGTTHVVMTRRELLERLAPLIPPPRAHQVRYRGRLVPCANGRDRVVPAGAGARDTARPSRPPSQPDGGSIEANSGGGNSEWRAGSSNTCRFRLGLG